MSNQGPLWQVSGRRPVIESCPGVSRLVAIVCAIFVLALPDTARSEISPEEVADLLEGRDICYDESGLIVRNASPICENTAAAHKLDDGRDTALLEGWYWFGVWLRSHTPGLKPWHHERELNFDQVLQLLEPGGNGVFYRHPQQPRWNSPWSEGAGTSSDQLIPLIAALGVWEKYAELKRLWNALPEDLLGKHAFNGSWLNVIGQPGSNCSEIKRFDCHARGEGDCNAAAAKYRACRAANMFSGDLLGPDVVNLFWRASGVNPLTVIPGNTTVQGGMVGEQQLMIKAYTRMAETSLADEGRQFDRDTVGPDLSLIVQLLMAKLRFPTPISEATALHYAHLRPLSYGSWLGTYYKMHGSDIGDNEIKDRMDAGIENGWRPDVSVLNGVIRWYHRPGSGGNPQLASLYAPIIDRYLGGMPDPFAAVVPSLASPEADDITQMKNRAANFASFYWIHIANENAEAIQYLNEAYADIVDYYGKRVSKATVIAEKRRFVERWPDRNYQPRWNDTQISCDAANQQCTIEGLADFEAKNLARGRQEQGTFRYSMAIKLTEGNFRIIAEKSEVIERTN